MTASRFFHKPLGEVLAFRNGKSIKPGGTGEFPVYGSNGIIGGSDEYKEENAIILGRVGAYCGSVAYHSGKFWASDNTIVAYPKNADHNVRFLSYLLKDLNLNRWAGGAAQPLLTQTVLKQVEAPIPKPYTQHKIASVLSAYDDLIENNLRRIRILEEMAQNLYREWFVKFRFPGHEKIRMVDSPLGKIPEEWEVQGLSEYVEFVRGVEPGSKNYLTQHEEGHIPFLRVGDLGKRESSIFIEASTAKRRLLNPDDIAITMDGTVGLVSIGLEGAYSSGIRRVVPKKECSIGRAFIFQLLQSEHIQAIIHAHAKGTTIKHASSSIDHMIFACPEETLIDGFEERAVPMREQILALARQNTNLRRTRDLLLPKLISGELDVSELHINLREDTT